MYYCRFQSKSLAGHDEKWLKNEEQQISNHINLCLSPVSAVKLINGHAPEKGCFILIKIEQPGDVVFWNNKAYHLIGTSSFERTYGNV